MTADSAAVTHRQPSGPVPAAPPRRTPAKRIVGLDGARGIACLGVLVLHVSAHYSPETMSAFKIQLVGQTLILFFALSGFLLFLPYVRAIVAAPEAIKMPNTKAFALHRFARILPGYLAIFLISSFVLRAVYLENASLQSPGTDAGTGMMTDPTQLLANLTLMQSYIPQYFQTGLNPSWTLSLEFVFYATLPVIGIATLKLRRHLGTSPYFLACIGPVLLLVTGTVGKIASPMLQQHYGISDPILVEWGPNWVAVLNRSFLSLADTFTFGMLAAIVFVAISNGAVRGHFATRVRWYCAALLLPASLASLALIAIHSHYANTALAAAAGLLVLFIVAPMARGEDSAVARGFDWRPLKYLGEVSLSVYLWHFPVLLTLGGLGLMAGDSLPGLLRNVVVVLAVTVAVSTLTYRYVERPALNLAKRYRPR